MNSEFDAVQPDLDALTGPAFKLAGDALKGREGFVPFGVFLDSKGVSGAVLHPGGPFDLANLHITLRKAAEVHGAVSVAVVEFGSIIPSSDGGAGTGGKPVEVVRLLAEHKGGGAVEVLRAFGRESDGAVTFGEPRVTAAQPEINAWAGKA